MLVNKIIRKAFNNTVYNLFVKDFNSIWFLIKTGEFKKLYSFVWSRLLVRDVAGGMLDRYWMKNPHLKGSPKEVEIEITTKCHLKCVMCEHTHWDENSYAKQQIGIDDFKKICEGFGTLHYMGIQGMGTPFLNSDFNEIIKYCYEKGMYVNIVESFSYTKDKHFDAIMKYKVDRFDISLDAGTKETYEKIRVGASFDTVLANLRKLKEYKIRHKSPFPEVFWRFVAFDLNKHEIPAFLEIVKELDLNLGHPTIVEIAGLLAFDKIKDLDTAPIDQELIERAQKVVEGTNIKLTWNHTSNDCRSMDICPKWVQPFIMVNGDAVMDCSVMMSDNRAWLHKNALGNTINTPYTEIWNNPEYKRDREAVNKSETAIPKWCLDCRAMDTKTRETKYGVLPYDYELFPEGKGMYITPDYDNITKSKANEEDVKNNTEHDDILAKSEKRLG